MAYAAVVSALLKIENLFYSSQSSINLFPTFDLESIYDELSCLESVLKTYTSMHGRRLRVDPLEEQIEDVSENLEDVLESHVSSHLFLSKHGSPDDEIDYGLVHKQRLMKLKQQINYLTKEMKKKLDLYIGEEHQIKRSSAAGDGAVSSRICTSGEDSNKLVGLDDELRLLMDWVMGSSDGLEMITTVVGMAGIGKTTLVRQVYGHPSVSSHFEVRVMLTVGPKFKPREVLLLVLDHVCANNVERLKKLDNYGLQMYLWKFLKPRRYLIVLDDVWDAKVWNELHLFFPKNSKKSRIVLTTRLLDVAPRSHIAYLHRKCFLSDEDSWKLLRQTAFADPKESCSRQLEKIGRKIAANCEGLPLALILVGELLCKAEKTVEYWEKISEDENPLNIGPDDTTTITKSLYLSYEILPRFLKVCFLYVGVFPRSYEISRPGLIRLWIAEGFLTPQQGVRIEGVGDAWLDELVSKSVVLVRESSSTPGKIKSCRVHFVFRNLCIGEARKEQFCHVMKKYAHCFLQGTNRQPRLCIHNNVVLGIKEVCGAMESLSSLRSLLCFGPHHRHPLWLYLSFGLLRVLDALRIHFYVFPHQVLKLVRLRYLALTFAGKLPKSISKLRKLNVLIMRRHHSIKSLNAPAYLPVEIWNLKWLRHLKCIGSDLPDPGFNDSHSLDYFLSLSGVSAQSCSDGVLARMPNLRKLGVKIELAYDEVETFSFFGNITKQLHCLQSFKCTVLGLNSRVIPPSPCFPPSLRKLTLSGCRFPWEYMAAIGTLRSLEVLKLQCYAFCGPVWESCNRDFPRLKSLLLEDLDLEDWRAELLDPEVLRAKLGRFPQLVLLNFRHCYKLRKIPLDIGDIPTLKKIEVEDCNTSLAALAKQIQQKKEKKRSLANDGLQVYIHFSWNDPKKMNSGS